MVHPKIENLMKALVALDRYPHKSKAEIMSDLGIARATAMRILTSARKLGVKINYDRKTTRYYIISWGIFDRAAVYKWCRKTRRTLNGE